MRAGAKQEVSAGLVRRNLMKPSREAKVESSESNFLVAQKLPVAIRLRDTPVPIPNTMVKT